MKYIRIITTGLFILTLTAWIISSIVVNRNFDDINPVITADSDLIQVSVKDGAKGLMKGLSASDNKDGDLTDKILIGKQSKFIDKAVCEVTYLVFDSNNNVGEYTRRVEYTDYESPKFELSKPLVYKEGEKVTLLDRLTVIDSIDGDISDKLKIVSSDVDNTEPGIYSIGVEVYSNFGDAVSAKFPVNIVKKSSDAPTVNLSTYLVTIPTGFEFYANRYLKNVTLTDGSMINSLDVEIDDQVNSSEPGIYQVVYSYTDDANQTGYTSLTVIVEE